MSRKRFGRHITLRLSDEMADELDEQAECAGLTLSDVVRLTLGGTFELTTKKRGAPESRPTQRDAMFA